MNRLRAGLVGLSITLPSVLACTDDPGGDSAESGDASGSDTAESESGGSESDTGSEDAPFDYCDGLPPDPTCYAEKREPESESVALAEAIADRHMQMFPASEQAWDWEAAVFMFSLTELYRVTGETRFRDHYAAWIDHHIQVGYAIETSDTCVPVAMAASLWAETGDPKYRALLDDSLAYFDAAVRSPGGGLSHFGINPIAPTLWVDSLFMLGSVMTRWAEVDDDQALLDELGLQFQVFATELQSPGGLWVHSWNWPLGDDTVYWGRGNGWVSAAGYDYLRALEVRGLSDPGTEDALAQQVAAIIASQDPGGSWWIVLNHPGETYLETSTAALFAYGLARGYRYGFLAGDEVLPVIAGAMAAVDTKIVPDADGLPVVTETSGPTGPGDLAAYASVPLEDDLAYGVGAVILALIETSGLPDAG